MSPLCLRKVSFIADLNMPSSKFHILDLVKPLSAELEAVFPFYYCAGTHMLYSGCPFILSFIYEIGEYLGVLLCHASYHLIVLRSLNFIQLYISIIQFTNHFSTSFYYQPVLVLFLVLQHKTQYSSTGKRSAKYTSGNTHLFLPDFTVFLHSRIRSIFLVTVSFWELIYSLYTTVAPSLLHFQGYVPAFSQQGKSVVLRNKI